MTSEGKDALIPQFGVLGGTEHMVVDREEHGKSTVPLPASSLNHISLLCRSIGDSVRFYQEVLGFIRVKRPSSIDSEGAWLFSNGMGIHLLESTSPEEVPAKPTAPINPKGCHISFQCTEVESVKRRLEEMEINYVCGYVEEEGTRVDQVFFHDPDGYMIEICDCQKIPMVPLISSRSS